MVGPWRCSRRGKRSYGGPASRWSRCVAHEVTAGKDNFMDEQGQERALRDYVGRNDKTKVIAKLQRRGGGAPAGEPPVDEQTQRDMMAFWHKKTGGG
mmetsp:Transcript_64880/g.174150  ORF Transcript_64880/g.174150 Transcript_64880/m.174150 type:complete len:97 (+) Transcript_64880:899-1189(+)